MSFVPACIIICSGAFRKLCLIWSKISIEDAPGHFRVFTLMFSSLFLTLSWILFNIESPIISISDFFSGLALLGWFFDFFFFGYLILLTVLFNCCDLFFYCIYTFTFIWIIYILGVVGCNFNWTLIHWDSICIFLALLKIFIYLLKVGLNLGGLFTRNYYYAEKYWKVWH